MSKNLESFDSYIRSLKNVYLNFQNEFHCMKKENELLRMELDVFKSSDVPDNSLYVLCQYGDNREGGDTVYVIGVYSTERKMKEAKFLTYKLSLREEFHHTFFDESVCPNYVTEGLKTYKVAISEEEMHGAIFSDYIAVYKDNEEIPADGYTIMDYILDKNYLDHLE